MRLHRGNYVCYKSRRYTMRTYHGTHEDVVLARQLKEKEGAQTCFVLIKKTDVENTTVQETQVVSIHSTLAAAEEAERVTYGDSVLLYEFVMDPPITKDGVANTCSADGPDWMEGHLWG